MKHEEKALYTFKVPHALLNHFRFDSPLSLIVSFNGAMLVHSSNLG